MADPSGRDPQSSRSSIRPSSRSSVRPLSSRSSIRALLGLEEELSSPIVKLVAPSARTTFRPGDQVPVQWQSSGAVVSHLLQYSLDDGRSYADAGEQMAGTVQSCVWQVPAAPTSWGRLKIVAQHENGSRAYSSSRAPFIIDVPEPNGGLVKLVAPRGNLVLRVGELVNVRWHSKETIGVRYELHLSVDGGATYRPVVRAIPGHLQGMRWMVPEAPTRQGRLRILALEESGQRSWDQGHENLLIVEGSE